MKGGWRWNAGRPASHRKTTSALSLDARQLAREGALTAGHAGTLRWPSGEALAFTAAADHITLDYRWTQADQSESVSCQIGLEHTACHFGGTRPWFRCPDCGARVAIIYVRKSPSCRTCSRLVYPSQAEDATARSWRRTQKIDLRLGVADDNWWKVQRPKGMRQATFERLRAAYWQEDRVREQALLSWPKT